MMLLSKKKVNEVLDILENEYPDAKCELEHSTPYELLVATILSAQCTDKRVNIVTKELFKKYNTPELMIELNQEGLESIIKTTGFYRNKARNILEMSKKLLIEYGGEVPSSREELVSLSGVGRKTANVVLSNIFKKNAIAVDTHVFRVSNRLGIIKSKDVLDAEKQLMERIDENRWSKAHDLLIFHGRYNCKSRNPLCESCCIVEYCGYKK